MWFRTRRINAIVVKRLFGGTRQLENDMRIRNFDYK